MWLAVKCLPGMQEGLGAAFKIWRCWNTPVISELEQWELEDQKFKVTLSYTVRRKTVWAQTCLKRKSKKQNKIKMSLKQTNWGTRECVQKMQLLVSESHGLGSNPESGIYEPYDPEQT